MYVPYFDVFDSLHLFFFLAILQNLTSITSFKVGSIVTTDLYTTEIHNPCRKCQLQRSPHKRWAPASNFASIETTPKSSEISHIRVGNPILHNRIFCMTTMEQRYVNMYPVKQNAMTKSNVKKCEYSYVAKLIFLSETSGGIKCQRNRFCH